ncbi:MAG: MATE family efflux transporter [Candidatus Thermoplasmatota archaeon]|nr:MATE family efflux transporter [Euryarchaeota archaeon]MBU4032597.1 MATE family efflux transporter [Candidatus Thermoplasmatota archaeon]MBU4071939.1 MATE family efflux transporter [Candidatus Thermoplasmatota archaeon]MBU4144436.1 MATE family efflux transporter [Candidatus Thermoplasmatota archaeon]MBU4591173.1 MATE family efflux transporter [Candidatus Thermoplasmatota archaeon]
MEKPGGGPSHKGVQTLLGNPRKAILKLALPMILAMSVQTLYNLVDAIWVSGLGTNALAAVGFFFPFFFMMMALATGIGTGGGAAVSRRIGSGDKAGADSVATHTMVIMVIVALCITLPFLLLARPIYTGLGAGDVVNDAVAYSNVIFAGAVIIFFSFVANSLLRAEGDAKRAMLAMILGGILNIILDPIFIFGPSHPGVFGSFGLDMGVAGAAWATLLSISVSSMLLFYWLFLQKSTYIHMVFRGFKFKMEVIRDIFRVGLPASVQQLSMSITALLINLIIVWTTDSTDGVAVFATGWRVSSLGILPLLGISTAVVSVTGAAYGMKNFNKMETAHLYATKLGLTLEVAVAAFIFIFAAQVTLLFTASASGSAIAPDFINYFRITCLFYPFVAFGMLSSAMFQGIGKGMNALLVTLLRTVILTPPLALLFSSVMGMGLEGIWWGLVMANIIGSLTSYTWARACTRKLKLEKSSADL